MVTIHGVHCKMGELTENKSKESAHEIEDAVDEICEYADRGFEGGEDGGEEGTEDVEDGGDEGGEGRRYGRHFVRWNFWISVVFFYGGWMIWRERKSNWRNGPYGCFVLELGTWNWELSRQTTNRKSIAMWRHAVTLTVRDLKKPAYLTWTS